PGRSGAGPERARAGGVHRPVPAQRNPPLPLHGLCGAEAAAAAGRGLPDGSAGGDQIGRARLRPADRVVRQRIGAAAPLWPRPHAGITSRQITRELGPTGLRGWLAVLTAPPTV